MGKAKDIWLSTGYTQFAIYGPESVNVERLAGLVGKSRSSFYHNFGDTVGFEQALIAYHSFQTSKVAEAIEPLQTMFPDHADIIAGFRDWTFFHRQMFLLSSKKDIYEKAFQETIALTGKKTSELWCKEAGLGNVPTPKMELFFNTVREAFFTRIEYYSFTSSNYTKTVRELNKTFKFLITNDTTEAVVEVDRQHQS